MQRVCVARGVRVTTRSTGFATLAVDGSAARSRACASGIKGGHFQPGVARGVGGDHPESATVRHDEKAAAARERLAGETAGQIEELLDASRPHGAGLPDGRVEGDVGACEGARVGGDSAGRLQGNGLP